MSRPCPSLDCCYPTDPLTKRLFFFFFISDDYSTVKPGNIYPARRGRPTEADRACRVAASRRMARMTRETAGSRRGGGEGCRNVPPQWRCRMKRLAVVLVLAVAMASTTALCAKKEKKAKGPKGLRGEYAIMAKVLEFTDAQKTQLAAALTACADEAKKWKEANADKLAEIKKQQAEARKNKDKDAMKKLATESKALRAEEAKFKGKPIAAAKALLTPDQKAKWDGFTVYRQVMRRLKKAGLTDEQDAKVRQICTAKAAEILEADKKAQGKAYKELTTAIIDSVLTAEQKAKLTAKPPKKNPADKKPKPDKKPRKGKKDKPEV